MFEWYVRLECELLCLRMGWTAVLAPRTPIRHLVTSDVRGGPSIAGLKADMADMAAAPGDINSILRSRI